MIGVAMFVGFLQRLGWQQSPVFAEGTEQHTVQQFLSARQDIVSRDRGVVRGQLLERILADVRIEHIELFGQVASDLFRLTQQAVKVTRPEGGNDAFGPQQEDKPLQQVVVIRQLFCLEDLERVLVGPLVIEPSFLHRRDDDPVTLQIDRVAIALIDRRHLAASVGNIKRIPDPLALQRDHEFAVSVEFAQDGIGVFAIHFDVLLAGERVAVRSGSWAGIPQQGAKEVSQEIGQELFFGQLVRLRRRDQTLPFQ